MQTGIHANHVAWGPVYNFVQEQMAGHRVVRTGA